MKRVIEKTTKTALMLFAICFAGGAWAGKLGEGITAYYQFNVGSSFTGQKWDTDALVDDANLAFSCSGNIQESGKLGDYPKFSDNTVLNGGSGGCYVQNASADSAYPSTSGNWTISLWAKRNGATSHPCLYHHGPSATYTASAMVEPTSGSNGGIAIYVLSDGKVKVGFSVSSDGSTFSYNTITSSAAFTWANAQANWHHVVVKRDGTTVSLLVDGITQGTATINASDNLSLDASSKLSLSGTSAMGWQNSTEDLCFWSRALSQDEIWVIAGGTEPISSVAALDCSAYSLEKSGGYVTSSTQVAFKNATLDEITADTIKGRFGGGYSGGAKGGEATFCCFNTPSEGVKTCEAQVQDATYIKALRLTFKQVGDDVTVSAIARFKENGTIGETVGDSGLSTVVTSPTGGGYALYNLRLPRTYESDATVVWNAGELLMPKIGTDGNKYVISLPASGISVDGSGNLKVASSGATTGATIDTPNTHIASVLIKYSSLSAVASSKVTLATAQATYNANGSLVVVGPRTTANNALTMTGYWDNSSENTYAFNTVPSLTAGVGYFMYSYHNDTCGYGGTYAYAGTSPASLSGGGNTSLRWTNDGYWIKQLSIGGPITTNSGVVAWPNVAIEKVAIFIGSERLYKGSDISNFAFSSESATITAAGTYTLAGDNPLFASVSSDEAYVIKVRESAILNIPSETTVNKITFDIAEGKTLTVTGKTLIANNVVVLGEGTLAFDVSDYNCKALARNAVAGAPYRVWPGNFASLTGSATIDVSAVEVPTGYSYNVISTSKGPALEFTTDKQFGSLNINFSGGRNSVVNDTGSRVSDNDSYSGLMHGASPVIGTSWNDVPAQNASDVAVAKYIRQDGSVANNGTATITLSGVNNPYTTGSDDGDRILFGYCDDGGSPVVTIKNIPFAKYRVIVYAATDSGTGFNYKTINDVNYSTDAAGSSATPTIAGKTGEWGSVTSRSTLVEGENYLVSDVISGTTTVTINNTRSNNARGGIPAVQIVEVGVYNTYDIDAAGTYNLTDIFPSVSDGYLCEINVNESATLNIGALSGTVSFNVASGKALTISGTGSITTSASILPNSGGMDLSGNTLTIANASGTVIASDSITIGSSGLQIPLSSTLDCQTIMMKVENIPASASRLLGWSVNYDSASTLDNYLSYTGSNLEHHFYYGKVWETTYGSEAWTRDASEHWVAISYAKDNNLGSQTAKGVRSYIDGAEKVVGTDLNWPSKITDKILVGGIALDGAEPATGMIVKDVHVYDDALTAAQVATVTAALNKGWTVGASGTALTSEMLRALPGNDSVLVSGAMTVKSDGSLAFANGVSIKLPAEATLPYQIASSGNCWVDDVSLQIGEKTPSTVTIRIENGYIVGTATPRTISSDENLGSLDDGEKYFINVTDDATVTIDQDVSEVGYVVFNVSAGKILKLDETAHSLDCPYEIISDPFSIAASDTKTFTAGTAVEWYPQIGSATTGNGAISSSGTTIAIDNASSLSAGNYTLVRWVTPQKMSSGYGYVDSLDTTGLAAGLTAELVYCVDRIVLRVYDTAAQVAKGTIKIWPYGDSITEGFNAGGTKANYRVLLAQKLSLLGFNVEMVGCYGQIDQADGKDPSGQAIPDAWKWHSAKHGATAGPTTSALKRANLCENVDTLCAQAGNPDVVLLLVGANDIVPATGLSAQRVVSSITNIVAHLVANLPDSKIVVGNQLGVEEGYTPGNYNHVVSMIPQVNNLLAEYFADLPEGYESRVFFADLNTYVKSGEYAVLYGGDHLHPDWLGHDQMAEGWLSVITNKFTSTQTFPSATVPAAPADGELGAAAKSELAAYRKGFNLCRRIDVASNINTSNPYVDEASGDGVTANIEKVGYFVEYVRADNHAHKWVWVDMDAFGTTLADVGLPNATHQQVVTSLHVKSNHNGIEDVAADDDTVTGFVEFSPYDYVETASSGVSGAPANNGDCCDWNDQISESGSYGSMQVHRISPSVAADGITRGGQVLFAYNNWQSSTSVAEFGIGNFSSHFYRGQSAAQSFDYTYTAGAVKMNANAYSVKRIEIWTKAVYTAEMSGNSNFSALTFSPTLPGDISECDLVVNVTDDATLTFDAEKSVGAITFNIAANKTLTLDGTSNLTVGKVIVSGPGKLLIDQDITIPALNADNEAVIEVVEGKKLTVTGALVVLRGATLTIKHAVPSVSGNYTLISAGSIYNAEAITIDVPSTESLDMETSIVEGDVILAAIPVKMFTYTAIHSDPAQAPSGWFNSWQWDGFNTYMRIGPNADANMVYEVSANEHPGSSLEKTSSFTVSLYADVSQMASDGTTRAVMFSYGGGRDNGNKFLVMYREGDYIKLANWNNGGFTGDWEASVPVATGYHLWTASFNASTGTITLYRDDGTGSGCKSSGTPAASLALASSGNNGLQIGTVWGNCPSTGNFAVGARMALAGVYGYDVALSDTDVQNIAASYPATDTTVIPAVIDMRSSRTLTVYSSTFDAPLNGRNNYFGVTHGTVVIPEGETVNVTYLQCLNTSWGQNSATLNVEGTLNVTTASTSPDVYNNGGRGILFGHYGGTGTYNITGSLIGRDAYLQGCFTAGAQAINVDGGLLAIKGFSMRGGASASTVTVTLSNGGTIEVAEPQTFGLDDIVRNFGRGTYKAAGDINDTKAINFNGASTANATIIDPHGYAFSFGTEALTGNGYIKVASSVEEGEKGSVTFAGSAAGFTGTVVIDDVSKDLITFTDITAYHGNILYAVTGSSALPSYLNGFAGTLTITGGPVDATGVDLSGATVHIADNCTFTANAGEEGALVLGSGATVTLKVTQEVANYVGYFPNVSGSGTISYYQTDGTPGELTGADHVNGYNLMPYYNVWIPSNDGNNNTISADAAARWRLERLPDENKNVAFKLNGDATVTIDATITFNDVQVYGNGILTIQQSGNNVLTIGKALYTTANAGLEIDSGLAFASGTKLEVESVLPKYVAVNCGTDESPFVVPTITGSGMLYVTEGHALESLAVSVGPLFVDGELTVDAASSAGAVTVAKTGVINLNGNFIATSLELNNTATVNVGAGTTLTVPTLSVSGGATVNMMAATSVLSGTTSLSGAGTVNWNGKNPDLTVWTTGSESTGWRGTNSVCNINTSSGAGANRKFESWGNPYSVVKVYNVGGWLTANANGTTISTEIYFDGNTAYAFDINNGNSYTSYSSNNRWTVFEKISGTGVITNTTKSTRPLVVVKQAAGYTGSIRLRTDDDGPIIAFSSTGSQKPERAASDTKDAGCRIFVMGDGHAVIGDGNDWYASHGITISGTNEFVGAATMTGPVTLNDGATLTFDDLSGDKKLTLASTPTFASGTVNLAFSSDSDKRAFSDGKKIIDWTTAEPLTGTFAFSNASLADDWVLLKKADGLYVYSAKIEDSSEGDAGTVKVVDNELVATVEPTGTAVTVNPAVTKLTVSVTANAIADITAAGVAIGNVEVKYGAYDTTGAYTIAKNDDVISFQLNRSGSVTISDETITVVPEARGSTAISFVGDTPQFAVKAIPGLWYRTQAYTTSACNDVEPGLGEAVQAEATTVTPAAPAFSGTVKYYKIRVAPSSNGF